jgi:hypothetical protein
MKSIHSNRHVVIDLETLGKQPTAVVRSVAVVAFDPWNASWVCDDDGDLFKSDPHADYLKRRRPAHGSFTTRSWTLDPEEQTGRTCDASTLLWWVQQPEAARERLSNATTTSLSNFVDDFMSFCGDQPIVWMKPPQFDAPILASLLGPWLRGRIKCSPPSERTMFCETYPPIDSTAGLLYRRRVHSARTIYEAASMIGCSVIPCPDELDEDPAREGIDRSTLHDPRVDALLTAITVTRAIDIIAG